MTAVQQRAALRLHLSESVYGASPAALAAASRALSATSVYPDPTRAELTAALAEHWGLEPGGVAVSNGSDELVLLAALCLGRDRGSPGLTTAGTFPGYRICLDTAGRRCAEVPLAGGRPDPVGFADRLPAGGVAFFCNPHNPTGTVLSGPDLDLLAAAASARGTTLVFDEAYMEFAPAGTPSGIDYLARGHDVVVLRTFSKAYGLAGLRVGYALGRPETLDRIRDAQRTVPFSVNRVALAAAHAALADQDFVAAVRRRNDARRSWFADRLAEHGRDHHPSVTNFVAIPVRSSAAVEAALLADHGILVRDTGRFGWPDRIRVSLAAEPDLTRFLAALSAVDQFPTVHPGRSGSSGAEQTQ